MVRDQGDRAVKACAAIEMGLDGETKIMDSPLRLSIRPFRSASVSRTRDRLSPAARSLGWRTSLRRLWATALDTIPK